MKQVLERLEGVRQSGENVRAVCPWCSHTRAFIWNSGTGWCCCFRCNTRGNVTALMRHLQFDPHAISIAAKRFVQKQRPRKVTSTRTTENYPILPEYILKMYEANRRLLPEQFTEETQKTFDIGYDKTEQRVTYPIRDYQGNLIAVSGRATKGWQTPRYKTYEFPLVPNYSPQNRRHLYLFDQVYPKHYFCPNVNHLTVIVEGFKAAMWCHQNGYDTVAVMGSQITVSQMRWISQIGGEKVILLDNEVGKHMQGDGKSESMVMLMKLLRNKNKASIARYPDNTLNQAPDDLNPEKLKWAIDNRAPNLIPNIWKRK